MSSRSSLGLLAVALALFATACERDLDLLGLAPFPDDPVVFGDAPGSTVDWFPFAGSKPDVFAVDNTDARVGQASLRITVPLPSDPGGSYAGGVIGSAVPRDLSGYNALTFWAKASQPITLNTAGFGNDNSGTSLYPAEVVGGLALSTGWTKYTLPMPDPSVLTQEAGLFFFAEGAEGTSGYSIWFDEVQYESLNTIANPRAAISNETIAGAVGASFPVPGTQYIADVAGVDVTMAAAPAYFDFSSSDESVATVGDDGMIMLVGGGTAEITASLGGLTASGTVTLNVSAPPAEAAPTPTQDAADVISLYSNAYTDVTVDSWLAFGNDGASYVDGDVLGDDVKIYSNLVFAGIEFTSQTIDISDMTHFRMDMWTPDDVTGATFTVGIVDFGADNAFGGGDDSRHDVVVNASTMPAIAQGTWVSIDAAVSGFAGLTGMENIAQIILVGGPPSTVYIDNIYFYDEGMAPPPPPPPPAPTMAAPTPTEAAANVISLFSNAYTDVAVDTWRTDWSSSSYEEIQVDGNDTKRYYDLDFNGIEFTGANSIDATGMTNLRIDVWSPDATNFGINLVDFGADNAFGGGDDTNFQVNYDGTTMPAVTTGNWISFDIPLTDFTGIASFANLSQMILVGQPTGSSTIFVDNIYFYDAGSPPPTAPTMAAPTPTEDAASVISLFSNAYTDVAVDTWNTGWSSAMYEEIQVDGNDTKRYFDLDFNGIEFTGANSIDATGMTHLRIDVWTPDATNFGINLVDFGADNAFGGGDDTNFQVNYDGTTMPAVTTGNWISFDIPLTDFTGIASFANLSQMILVGQPTGASTIFVDNIYFYDENAAPPTAPTMAAPTPTDAAANVISLFSNAYTDVTVDTWNTGWSSAMYEEIQVDGNDTKRYFDLDFNGIEFTGANSIDATGMTHLRIDIWTPDATNFGINLVDFGADNAFGGGDDTNFQVNYDGTTMPAITTGGWISFDIPLTDFTGIASFANLSQMILVGQPTGASTIFVDNIYFRN